MARSRLLTQTLMGLTVVVAACAAANGCGSDNDVAGATDGDGGSSGIAFIPAEGGGHDAAQSRPGQINPCVAPKTLTLTPASTLKDVIPGGHFTQTYAAMADGKDVTSQARILVSDTIIGTLNGSTFEWGGKYGGALKIQALYCGVTAVATLDLKLVAPPFTAGTNAASLPGVFAAAPAGTSAACKPVLKYPPDQILLPPNTNVIEVHFLGAGNDQFEISFTNAVTDVRIYTTCTAPPVGGRPDVANGAPAPGVPGGCLFELNQAEWDLIANTNREGGALTVGVRGLGCDIGNVASSETRQISFARHDVIGTIYYWASIRLSGNENSGGVYRYDYGKRGQFAEAVLTPAADANGNGANSNGLCVGCHLIDREGRKMVFGFDDNDDDDEYGDMWTNVWDIPSRTSTSEIKKGSINSFTAGYSSWNRAASKFLKSDGWGNGKASQVASAFDGPRGTFHVVSSAGAPAAKTQPALANLRGTTPDIAPSDNQVVFAAMANRIGGPKKAGFFGASSHNHVAPDDYTDEYFSGAGLYIGGWDSATGTIGPPTAIFPAAPPDAVNPPNHYYPAFSPDGSLIVFNHATSGANFHNPKARVQLVTAGGGAAADLHRANETSPVENGGELTNSWVRWAPFIQDFKGKKLAWVTFSSTRSYGLRIDNTGTVDCHPRENPDNTVYPEFSGAAAVANCARAQLWMAAIDLDSGKVAAGNDVSFPAFWLPFQDSTTNNHLGQWAQKSFKGTCTGDAGPCPTGYVCDDGACAAIPPTSTTPPPQAQCTQHLHCATGTCCSNGSCGVCADAGAGVIPCNTCLDCGGQACKAEACGACTTSSDCCAPLACEQGRCVPPVK